MKGPTRSERIAALLLSALFLAGVALHLIPRIFTPFSLEVLSPSEEAAFVKAKQVSLRRGTPEDFARLPRIGPALAARIVDFQKKQGFERKEDLLNIEGIGAKTYDEIKDQIVLE